MRLVLCILASLLVHAAVVAAGEFARGKQRVLATRSVSVGKSMALNWVAIDPSALTPSVAPPSANAATLPTETATEKAPETKSAAPETPPTSPPQASVQRDSGVAPFDGDHFFPTIELTRPPQTKQLVELEPPSLPILDFAGKIVLTLWINADGRVVEINKEQDELPAEVSRFVLNAFGNAAFVPGERQGRRVGSVMRIEVKYDKRDAQPVAAKPA